MSDIKIVCNNRPRDVLAWPDLAAKEAAEFGYLDTAERQDDAQFVRYRGTVYNLAEFTSLSVTGTPEFKPWDGVHADSYFSGVLVRFVPGTAFRSVMVARFYQ